MEFEDFKTWLCEHYGMKTTSAKDVISRIKRVNKIIDINRLLASKQMPVLLDENKEFSELNMYVKSQIRRAIKLYSEFLDQNNV